MRLREDNHDVALFSNIILITLKGFGVNQLFEQRATFSTNCERSTTIARCTFD